MVSKSKRFFFSSLLFSAAVMMDSIARWFFLLILLRFSSQFDVSVLTNSFSLSPSSNRSLVSSNHVFELGFFNPNLSGPDRWYVGIWYKDISERSYVWVANRDKPLKSYNGTLQISGGKLFIRGGQSDDSTFIWSSSGPSSTQRRIREDAPVVVAELRDDGNFVVRFSDQNDSNSFLWQSFDNPTDTLLPGMKLGLYTNSKAAHVINRYLSSWKSPDDPSRGNFILKFQTQGSLELAVTKGGNRYYRSGPWNGEIFSKLPRIFDLIWNSEEEVNCMYVGNGSSYSRLQMGSRGLLRQFTWNQRETMWESWSPIVEICDIYNLCGDNAYCDMNATSLCTCIQGFDPRGPNIHDDGCVRKAPLNCRSNEFYLLRNMSFPHTSNPFSYRSVHEIKRCREFCINDCDCLAFAMTNSLQFNSSICLVWKDALVDLRRYPEEGVHLHVRLNGRKENNKGLIIALVFGISIPVALVSLAIYCCWKRRLTVASHVELVPREIDTSQNEIIDNPAAAQMDFGMILQATNNFSNVIGHGGFGEVYKGRLLNGQEIAVKKLFKKSSQGFVEFKNEVEVIANLQHINLVRLLGWSIHEDEMVLVYEYLGNGSLESHLFGGGQRSGELNWQRRYEIIKGIARGLTYLHEGSQDTTIHRDVKPENILLNREMTPKISDFGLARIFEKSDSEVSTKQTAGTRGYMSPEYAESGKYSANSDTYSFGVMVLEIVSGKKNRSFSYLSSNTNLLSFVWTHCKDKNWKEIVDEVLWESSRIQEIERCVEIGLLCVQQFASDRPKMSAVVAMLENEKLEVPRHKTPGFFMDPSEKPSSSNPYGECSGSASVNQYTFSGMTPR